MRAIVQHWWPRRAHGAGRDILDAKWHDILGGRLEAWPSPPTLVPAAKLRDGLRDERWAVVFVAPDVGVCALLVDRPFAALLADRALGPESDSTAASDARPTLTPLREGALALIASRCARAWFAPAAAPVVRGVTDRFHDALAAIGASELASWTWRATVGHDAGEVTLLVDARCVARVAPAPSGADDVEVDTNLVIACDVVLARSCVSGIDLITLAPGDVIALEGALAFDEHDRVRGDIVMAAGEIDIPLHCANDRATLAAPGRIRERSGRSEDTMSTKPVDDGAEAMRTEVVSSLPVEVEIVAGQGTYAVGEIRAWRVGEVVALPTPIGGPVLVRAGGRPIARGELCDVDGDVGVRITELL